MTAYTAPSTVFSLITKLSIHMFYRWMGLSIFQHRSQHTSAAYGVLPVTRSIAFLPKLNCLALFKSETGLGLTTWAHTRSVPPVNSMGSRLATLFIQRAVLLEVSRCKMHWRHSRRKDRGSGMKEESTIPWASSRLNPIVGMKRFFFSFFPCSQLLDSIILHIIYYRYDIVIRIAPVFIYVKRICGLHFQMRH